MAHIRTMSCAAFGPLPPGWAAVRAACVALGGVIAAGPVLAQDLPRFSIEAGAPAAGAGLPMVGGLSAAPTVAPRIDPRETRGDRALPYGAVDPGLALVGSLAVAAPTAEPGRLSVEPLDTSRLSVLPDPRPLSPSSRPVAGSLGGPAVGSGGVFGGASLADPTPAPTPVPVPTPAAGAAGEGADRQARIGAANPWAAPVGGGGAIPWPDDSVRLAVPATGTADPASPPPLGEGDPRTLVSADSLTRDDDLGMVVARGNVVVVSGGQTLQADVVAYSLPQDVVTASGGVSLTRTGPGPADTTFADYMELSGDLKAGFVRGIKVLRSDGARMAALYGEQDPTTRTREFARGVYTACASCSGADSALPTLTGQREGPRTPPPVWQVKAARITHDEEAQDIIFRDAWLELYGIPVLYTPYLSQPDPTVYRRSGFLPPSSGTSDHLGAHLEVPYYIVLDDHGTAEVALQVSQKQLVILHGALDRLWRDGLISLSGSFNPMDEDGWAQGHVDGRALWQMDPVWQLGVEGAAASRPLYLRRLGLSPQNDADTLTSRAHLDGVWSRSRLTVEALAFQALTEDLDQDTVPLVPLMVESRLVTDPLWADSHLELTAGLRRIQRDDGTDSTRLALGGAGELPWRDGLGGLGVLRLGVDGSLYAVDDLAGISPRSDTPDDDDVVARLVPRASLLWRYPLMRTGGPVVEVLEPRLGLVAAWPTSTDASIPNEDSRFFALSVDSLFQPDRLGGQDRAEGGVWVAYGLGYSLLGPRDDRLTLDIGQSVRLVEDDQDLFGPGSGLEDPLSDIVARLSYQPSDLLRFQYDVQLDHDDLSPVRHDLWAAAGTDVLRGSLGYTFATESSTLDGETVGNRSELAATLSSRLAQHWLVHGGGIYSFDRNEPVSIRTGLTYEDECLRISSLFDQDFTKEYGVEGDTSVMVTFTLKTLGSQTLSP